MRSKLLTTLIDTRPRPHHPSASLCARCTILPNRPPPPSHPPSPRASTRTLTTTTPLLKKGGKQDSKRTLPPNASKTPPTSPFDLTDYDAAIARAHTHLKSELSKIKAGGLDPETIEGVKVQLVKGEKKKKGGGEGTTTRVGDIASVVVRGRNVAVLVAEMEHVKPILSALLHSNLNPTISPTDPLTLLVPIPATTLESRREAKVVAGKRGEKALFALREARGAQRKRYRALELGKVVGPDELRRAEREVERVSGVAVGEAKRLVEGCRRGLEGG